MSDPFFYDYVPLCCKIFHLHGSEYYRYVNKDEYFLLQRVSAEAEEQKIYVYISYSQVDERFWREELNGKYLWRRQSWKRL